MIVVRVSVMSSFDGPEMVLDGKSEFVHHSFSLIAVQLNVMSSFDVPFLARTSE